MTSEELELEMNPDSRDRREFSSCGAVKVTTSHSSSSSSSSSSTESCSGERDRASGCETSTYTNAHGLHHSNGSSINGSDSSSNSNGSNGSSSRNGSSSSSAHSIAEPTLSDDFCDVDIDSDNNCNSSSTGTIDPSAPDNLGSGPGPGAGPVYTLSSKSEASHGRPTADKPMCDTPSALEGSRGNMKLSSVDLLSALTNINSESESKLFGSPRVDLSSAPNGIPTLESKRIMNEFY